MLASRLPSIVWAKGSLGPARKAMAYTISQWKRIGSGQGPVGCFLGKATPVVRACAQVQTLTSLVPKVLRWKVMASLPNEALESNCTSEQIVLREMVNSECMNDNRGTLGF